MALAGLGNMHPVSRPVRPGKRTSGSPCGPVWGGPWGWWPLGRAAPGLSSVVKALSASRSSNSAIALSMRPGPLLINAVLPCTRARYATLNFSSNCFTFLRSASFSWRSVSFSRCCRMAMKRCRVSIWLWHQNRLQEPQDRKRRRRSPLSVLKYRKTCRRSISRLNSTAST